MAQSTQWLNLSISFSAARLALPFLRWKRWSSAGFSVRLVVTQPDRPHGRGMELALPR